MHLTKKVLIAFFLICTLTTVSTTTIAAGKIENATLEEIKASIDSTIELSEKALAAIESGADKETVYGLLSDVKQMGKEIHATRRAAIYKSKAATQMKKARTATKKDDLEKLKDMFPKVLSSINNLKKLFLSLTDRLGIKKGGGFCFLEPTVTNL